MREFNSQIIQKGRLLPGIHGLRGIAALAIVLYHLQHLALINPPPFFQFIGRDFGYGVHLFFIMSAFSLMHSTDYRLNQQHWASDYLIKRFFRIAPLYYCVMVFMIVAQMYYQDVSGETFVNLIDILLNATFTFEFVPWSGFVWGGWAIGVEMIFYVVFPFLILVIRSHRSALFFLLISIIVSSSVRSALHMEHINAVSPTKWDWSYFAFAPNLCFFAFGMYAYRATLLLERKTALMRIVIPFIAIILMGGLMLTNVDQPLMTGSRWDLIIWGIGFTALCMWQSSNPTSAIANRFFEHLGERSYSLYLVHPVLITFTKGYLTQFYTFFMPYVGAYAFFICSVLIIGMLLIIVEVTYRIIEIPGIRLGRRLIASRS